jgi:hypothetical protein
MSTDRPDVTESPITVPAGHFQFETEAAAYTRDGETHSWSFGSVNAKFGVTERLDFQVVTPAYQYEEDGLEGFSDVELRAKLNLWGNDEGATALALMPFLKIPSASAGLGNGEFEGGLIVPFSLELPGGWSLGLMAAFDLRADDAGGGWHLEFLDTVALGRDLWGPVSGFVELASLASTQSGSGYEAYANGGVVWEMNPNLRLDAGFQCGLTGPADDFTIFAGLSWRY